MTTTSTPAGPNAIGATLGLFGDEWNLLIVRQALEGARRYGEFQNRLGIAPSVLSARLATLTAAGVLDKDAAGQGYRLADPGKDLWSVLLCIWAWEQRWVQGEALPTMRHQPCGDVFTPVLTCLSCGAPAEAADVDLQLGPSGNLARAVPTGTNRRRSGSSRAPGPGLFAETMALIGSRWSSALLGSAFLGARRFTDFEQRLGAPPNVISERLRTFVELGVLDDSYHLTVKGLGFFPVVALLVAWGERWVPAPDGPALLARHRSCGHAFGPSLRCSACGSVLNRSAVLIEGEHGGAR